MDLGSFSNEPDDEPPAALQPPTINLPKGGGALRSIGEKFTANPATGTGSLTLPIAASPGRSGFGPQLTLSYDSGSGNGPFGLGWSLSVPQISRKTDKGLPRYGEQHTSDEFILSGAEDLVPVLAMREGEWRSLELPLRPLHGGNYRITRFRPRLEGLFANIEFWANTRDPTDSCWRTITRDNTTSWYGRTAESRVSDPLQPSHTFTWLLCESHDDRGNVMVYRYKAEDSAQVNVFQSNERNRSERSRSANRYLKRICYANTRPYYPELTEAAETPLPDGWLFEVVFDYGEHDKDSPLPTEQKPWSVRPDPFSRYRAGFEVRTYRLCQRVLMFHHFPQEPEVGRNCLVRSTDFTYRFETAADAPGQPLDAIYSQLDSVTQCGYRRQNAAYLKKSLPSVEFGYSQPMLGNKLQTLMPQNAEHLPEGVDSQRYQWLDLNGEGLSGVLSEHQGNWLFRANRSPLSHQAEGGTQASFGPAQPIETLPGNHAGPHQFLDLAGDGRLDAVQLATPLSGFYERDDGSASAVPSWESFRPFVSQPNINWTDPNIKLLDLTGDGLADVLITEEHALVWHPSLGEAGFGQAERRSVLEDEELGPRLLFADGTETVFVADVSGDGLTDILRIRNGEVCYWPNLGYGRFGAKVSMDDPPWFDNPEQFEPARLRLADIDGSGTTDILYLGHRNTAVWFNLSGNGWSKPQTIEGAPQVSDLTQVSVVDLLGNGTVCLVWSSASPHNAQAPMQYLELMAQGKPHLMVATRNNMGAETHVRYVPSTYFYLQDKEAGNPWATKLPFPVHVVERVETLDRISRNRFVSRYTYHHGYFDGQEREFRGFGRVDQYDTEEFAALSRTSKLAVGDNIEQRSHVPPALTKRWFHTGAWSDTDNQRNRASFEAYLHEYYREPGLSDKEARDKLLPDSQLPPGLSLTERREAVRALKGSLLRQEVYGLDGSDKQATPYSITEQSYAIKTLQPMMNNPHAVFFTHASETLNYQYERNPADPRVGHTLILQVDSYGNVLKEVSVNYGRRKLEPRLSDDQQNEQTKIHAVYSENRFTNAVTAKDAHRVPLPCETRTYELNGYEASAIKPISPKIFNEPTVNSGQRRLIEHVRTLYRPDDLGRINNDAMALLPLGRLESLAIGGETYNLVFTADLLKRVFQRFSPQGQKEILVPDPAVLLGIDKDNQSGERGGYVDLNNDGHWWRPSGRGFFINTSEKKRAPTEELARAKAHFYLLAQYRNAFGESTAVEQDDYDFLIRQTRDALNNTTSAVNDYRVLQARQLTDPNGNRSETAFDALGMVVATATMGKEEENLGDSLSQLETDLDEQTLARHLQNPLRDPHSLLGSATSRLVYDLYAYQRSQALEQPLPAVQWTLQRETHVSDLKPGHRTELLHTLTYSDGFGREIQNKILTTPAATDGLASDESDDNEVTERKPSPRWIASGWTLFNNKGLPVREFEPFFTDTHHFQYNHQAGVSPTLFYDPLGRLVATLHANHSWEKVVFDAWHQQSWDVNDTLLIQPQHDQEVARHVSLMPETNYLPTWFEQRINGELGVIEQQAAQKTQSHAGTPIVSHLDSLGRPFLTIAHNRAPLDESTPEQFHSTRFYFDIKGNETQITDALGRAVIQYRYDLVGNRIYHATMDSGERWLLSDVSGKPIRAWDSRGHQVRTIFDPLRRPLATYLSGAEDSEILTEKMVYGETLPDPEAANLRGMVVEFYDQAGVAITKDYDFKGNLLTSTRTLAVNYHSPLDWSISVPLEDQQYVTHNRFDALNRVSVLTTPDDSRVHVHYDQAGLVQRMTTQLSGEKKLTDFVTNVDYDAKGQRSRIVYANGVSTHFGYDPLTFRLIRLHSTRNSATKQTKPKRLQDVHYTYDAVGNVIQVTDKVRRKLFFRNEVVSADRNFIYDALYRLVEARGREHLALHTGAMPYAACGSSFPAAAQPGDGAAMTRYREQYGYDAVGNLLTLHHANGQAQSWQRSYYYEEASALQGQRFGNRLSKTRGGETTDALSYAGSPGLHGNVTRMSHLAEMTWDYRDQLQSTRRQKSSSSAGSVTWYVYGASGQRIRKITEYPQASPDSSSKKTPKRQERVYVGGLEVYRKFHRDGSAKLERQSLHIMDAQQRIAVVERRTQGNDRAPERLIRFQLNDLIGSSAIEVDDQAGIISYEEYSPFGNTTYQAVRSETETPKRFRYAGKEKDEESGFYYYGARYYPPWLGRWIAPDPAGIADGTNPYMYVKNNPVALADPTGAYCDPSMQSCLVDPTQPTAREEALQQSLPEDERYLPAQSFPEELPAPGAHSVTPSAPQWELGPRGEHIPTAAYTGGPLRPIDQYDKPYAVAYAKQGNYEAAELAQNYLCATCHILTKVDPADFSIGGYSRGWQRNYIQGLVEVPLMANPIGGAWEIGVSGGQAITGESSGLHISNISSVMVDKHWDVGRKLSTTERVIEGGAFVVGAATLGYGAYASRTGQVVRGGNGFGYADEVLEGGSGTVYSGHGELRTGAGTVTVPEGTSITMPRQGVKILDRTAHFLERGDWEGLARAAKADPRIAADIEGMMTHLPGAQIPNFTLKAPTGLKVYSNSITVEDATFLDQLLTPNQGNCIWAACTNYRLR